MNSKKIAYIIMTLSFVLIMSGGVSTFVAGLKNDQAETYRRIVTVNDAFKVFSKNTSSFEEYRDQLYKDYFNDFYFDTMYQNDSDVKKSLSNYESIVDDISKNTTQLDTLCKNVYYPDSEVNSKCLNYKSIYEQVMNYFVSDVILYNQNVKKYNDYIKDKDSSLSLNEYSTKKNYIDYNEDKKYDGKED